MPDLSISWEDIRKHDKEKDAWVVMNNEVFDVSKFLGEHPGGSTIVLPHLGTDIGKVGGLICFSIFYPERMLRQIFADDDVHSHSDAAHHIMQKFKIGNVAGAPKSTKSAISNGSSKSSHPTTIDFNKPIILQVLC